MNRPFLFTVIGGVALLGIFSYFIFGFNEGTTKQVKNEQTVKGEQTKMDTTLPKDLKIEDIKEGTGPAVKSGDIIVIDYLGTLSNGTKFDSSYDRGQPFETQIGVGQVIEGWDKGVIGMKVGGKRKLTIPPALGYGDHDMGTIPPNSTLIFEVELRAIK